jgi:hypothetical protein
MNWIKVSEGLPDIADERNQTSDYCVCCSDKFWGPGREIYSISRYDYGFESWEYQKGHDREFHPITHWAYIEPPK